MCVVVFIFSSAGVSHNTADMIQLDHGVEKYTFFFIPDAKFHFDIRATVPRLSSNCLLAAVHSLAINQTLQLSLGCGRYYVMGQL